MKQSKKPLVGTMLLISLFQMGVVALSPVVSSYLLIYFTDSVGTLMVGAFIGGSSLSLIFTYFLIFTDEWGGSLENCLRFLNLVVKKVRTAVGPRFPIGIRILGSERIEGGYGLESAKTVDGKIDLIHVSSETQEVPYSTILMHLGIFQKVDENFGLAAKFLLPAAAQAV